MSLLLVSISVVLGLQPQGWRHWSAVGAFSGFSIIVVCILIGYLAERHRGIRKGLRDLRHEESGRAAISLLTYRYERLLRQIEASNGGAVSVLQCSFDCFYLLDEAEDIVREKLGSSFLFELDSRAGLAFSRIPPTTLPSVLNQLWETLAWRAERFEAILGKLPS